MKCEGCSIMVRYNELNEFICSMRGIKNIEYYVNDDETILALTIRYNYKIIDIKNMKLAIESKGFEVGALN